MNKICISFDVDWAKDAMIEPLIRTLQEHKIKATFFATHHSELLANIDNSQFEIGIHPNFNNSTNDFEKPITDLLKIYPNAKGVRSHSLFESGKILFLFQKYGLKYVSNLHLPYHENLHPVVRYGSLEKNPLVGIPFYFADDFHYMFRKTFHLNNLNLDKSGLKNFAFHPIHTFMNTHSEDFYNSYKNDYQNPEILKHKTNKGNGVATLFNLLINHITANNINTFTLSEISNEYILNSKL